MAIVGIYKQNSQWVVKPRTLYMEPKEGVIFVGASSSDFKLKFDSKVCKNMDPGNDYPSSNGFRTDQAVDAEVSSEYVIAIDEDRLTARIVVKEPPALLRFVHLFASLLLGVLLGAGGAWWYLTR